ncbi:hypothetical protein V6N13_100342 [Hibiscus sabdariffa]
MCESLLDAPKGLGHNVVLDAGSHGIVETTEKTTQLVNAVAADLDQAIPRHISSSHRRRSLPQMMETRVLECWNVDPLPTLDKLTHVGSSLDSWQQDMRRKSTTRIRQLHRTNNKMMDKPLSNDTLEILSKTEVELKTLVNKDEAYWCQ